MMLLSGIAVLAFLTMPLLGEESEDAVYFEDFSDSQSALKDWKMKDPVFYSVSDEGKLKANAQADVPTVGCSSPKFKAVTDARITFAFQLKDSKELQYKINYAKGGHICRFMISRNGFYLRVNSNRNIPITKAFDMDKVKAKIDPNQWHTFVIEKKGDTITGSIEGIGSKSYQQSYFAHDIGTFGLAVRGGSAMLDDIRIAALSTTKGKVAIAKPAPKKVPPASSRPKMKPHSKPVPASPTAEGVKFFASIEGFLETHCYDCHDDTSAKGNLDFFALGTDLNDAETMRRWVHVFDRVEMGEMPPEKKEQPEAQEKRDFLSALASPLMAVDSSNSEVVLRRLNRAEYENTINDLFGVNMQLQDQFPVDAKKHGFDTNGEGLTLSTELVQLYLEAANQVIDRAIGQEKEPKRIKVDGPIRQHIHDNMYDKWFKLLEIGEGTVIYSSEFGAGSQMNHFRAPVEGTYRFRFHAKAFQSDEPVMMQLQTGMVTRSGKKRFQGYFSIPPEGRVVEVMDYLKPGESAYPRPFGTLKNISGFLAQGKRKIEEYKGAGLLISRVEIEGPIDEWPPSSRAQLLGDVKPAEGKAEDAETIFRKFLPRAFRRPVDDQEIARYADQVTALMVEGRTFREALQWALAAVLCSADFLFIEEPNKEDGDISDVALANRLSYFLWSSMPDEELMDLAVSGKLHDPETLRAQTERLLSHEKAVGLTRNFARQWLHLREIDATSPDTKLFPEFDNYLRDSMVRESELFFETVLQDNKSVRDFIVSDWLVVNERLGQHYELENPPTGEEFQRVKIPANSPRGGLMTQASILKVTANGANTSPVTRGVWILENVLGIHPPPPPPNVPAVVPDVTGANTLRQLLDKHRDQESCNTCHRKIDPPGFALESFDPIGAWRTKYRFQGSQKLLPVDASGTTLDGKPFKNIQEFKRIMSGEIDQVTYGLAEKLLTYGTGRAMGFSDRAEMKRIVKESAQGDYGFRDLIHLVVQSKTFRKP